MNERQITPKFKRIDTDKERKLKYEGFCTKCGKLQPHRFDGGSIYEDRYRCMKCKSINTQEKEYHTLR
jgi:phage FluMu protein Com